MRSEGLGAERQSLSAEQAAEPQCGRGNGVGAGRRGRRWRRMKRSKGPIVYPVGLRPLLRGKASPFRTAALSFSSREAAPPAARRSLAGEEFWGIDFGKAEPFRRASGGAANQGDRRGPRTERRCLSGAGGIIKLFSWAASPPAPRKGSAFPDNPSSFLAAPPPAGRRSRKSDRGR